ncbi:hypothetical protein N9955_00700 [bacterium]|nr:hypothetical protein [bacterium]
MKLPKTHHPKIRYQNGQTGWLMTTQRDTGSFPVITVTDELGMVIHHLENGLYIANEEDHGWNIVEVIES